MKRTSDLIRRHFWQPSIEDIIWEYVRGCRECQQNKNLQYSVFELLQPLEIRQRP